MKGITAILAGLPSRSMQCCTGRTCKPWPGLRLGCAQSGKYSKAPRRYACIKPLRNALHQFARA